MGRERGSDTDYPNYAHQSMPFTHFSGAAALNLKDWRMVSSLDGAARSHNIVVPDDLWHCLTVCAVIATQYHILMQCHVENMTCQAVVSQSFCNLTSILTLWKLLPFPPGLLGGSGKMCLTYSSPAQYTQLGAQRDREGSHCLHCNCSTRPCSCVCVRQPVKSSCVWHSFQTHGL